jgi:hypothetical protein
MIASVGCTGHKTDYNINLGNTPFAIAVNGEKLTSRKSKTGEANDVDFVLASA